jgi:hypothetical protein
MAVDYRSIGIAALIFADTKLSPVTFKKSSTLWFAYLMVLFFHRTAVCKSGRKGK